MLNKVNTPVATAAISAASSAYTSLDFSEQTSVPSATETTIISYSPASTTHRAALVYAHGTQAAIWTFYLNAAIFMVQQSSVTDKNAYIYLNMSLKTTDTLEVKVEHQYSGKTPDFRATLLGYEE